MSATYELMRIPSIQANTYVLITTTNGQSRVAARHYPSPTQMSLYRPPTIPDYTQLKTLALAQGQILTQEEHTVKDYPHWFKIISAANQRHLLKSGSPTLQSTPAIPTSTRHPIATSQTPKIIIVATPNGLAKLAEQILPHPLFSRKSSRIKGLLNADPNELMLKIGESLKLGTPPKFFNPSDAMRIFNFGVGHTPGNGAIYIQHPISTNTYIKPEEFREILAKEKEAAFRQLAASLGAKKLTLTDVQFDDKKIKSKASISKAALTVGIQAQFDSKGSFIKSIYSEFGPPRRVPHVPATLEPWVAMEPELKTMVHGRLDGHLINSIVNLEFRKELGIEGEICAQLLDKGGTIGATYQKIHHSIWSFEVEYYPL